ncbi:hypothetical protein NPIL_543171 [Nephila pilipes]|uniref:Uncharacterized protein n=1 Tax=Nephila pilipes TaxID=299642 RepID=A0A8X6PXL0_NEPPI|nr:hypothetical protein NPIL_543171 [Nephila pilipes]
MNCAEGVFTYSVDMRKIEKKDARPERIEYAVTQDPKQVMLLVHRYGNRRCVLELPKTSAKGRGEKTDLTPHFTFPVRVAISGRIVAFELPLCTDT